MTESGALTALIVDDEPPARSWLQQLLREQAAVTVAGEADGVEAARVAVADLQPDVVFLDIQMPPYNGFDLLPDLPERTRVVFVTAFDSYAVKAFEANALDYLLKPVHPDRLADTLSRLCAARPDVRSEPQPDMGADSPPPDDDTPLDINDLLPLRSGRSLRVVPVAQIAAIRAEGAYTRVLISGQRPMMVLRPIGQWARTLPAPPFVRLDRSRIVNLTQVREAKTLDRNRTLVKLSGVDEPFQLGRLAAQRLRKMRDHRAFPSGAAGPA